MSSMTRREFVEAALAACACTLCPLIAEAQPPTGAASGAAAPASAVPTGPVTIGATTKFARAGIWDEFAKTNAFLVVSEKGKVYAISANCTHKRGIILKDSAVPGQLKCTKHDGKFNLSGVPVSGPPKLALARLGISKNAAGQLVVDPSKKFEQADWEKDGAFVKA